MRKREKLRRKNVNISSRRIQPPTHYNVDYIIEIGLRQWKRCVLSDLFTGTYDNYFSDGSTHHVISKVDDLSVKPRYNFVLGIQRRFQNSHQQSGRTVYVHVHPALFYIFRQF